MSDNASQYVINHIAIVADGSYSMSHLRPEVVKVVDHEVETLAVRSEDLGQETRVTIYRFSSDVECLVYDKDVLRQRKTSIDSLYQIHGNTALVDATRTAIRDLQETPQKYGDHAFLIFVVTDGQENWSNNRNGLDLLINGLPDNWTLAALVPDQHGVFEAKRFGFPANNIAVWNTTSAHGMREVGDVIRKATEGFMQGRARGVRGSKSIFSTGADAVNDQTVKTTLVPLSIDDYLVIPVHAETSIRDFVVHNGITWRTGISYYELMKREEIQATKKILVLEKATNKVYGGSEARDLLGLPDLNVKVTPDHNPGYKVYVQSTSVNRKLLPGTSLIVLT